MIREFGWIYKIGIGEYKCMMEHNDEAFGEELKKLEARL